NEGEQEARALARQEAVRRFVLSKGPLFKCRVIRLAAKSHVLVITMHHIVSDAWSTELMFSELRALYGAFVEGVESGLDELAIQYADYSVWQRQWFTREEMDTQLDYWKGQLAGIQAVELPADRPRPAIQSQRGAMRLLPLTNEMTESIKALSGSEGATTY